MSAGLLLVLLACSLPLVWVAVVYNRLVGLRNGFRNAFSQIDVQLKHRHDLVPALVEVARAHRVHERQVLESVVAARQGAASARASAAVLASDPGAIARLDAAECGLSGSLNRLFDSVEAYPDLRVDATLVRLGEELAVAENRIASARQAYNEAVADYNNGIEPFPALLVASACRFRRCGQLRSTRSRLGRESEAVTL